MSDNLFLHEDATWTSPAGGSGATGATGPTGDTGATGATGSTLFLSQTTLLMPADILALDMTPIVVVSAPGAGKIIFPLYVWMRFNYGNNTYAVDGAELYTVLFNSAAGSGQASITSSTFTDNAASSERSQVFDKVIDLSADLEDAEMVIFTGGENVVSTGMPEDSTMTIIVFYTVIPAP